MTHPKEDGLSITHELAGKDWTVGNHRIWLARQLLDARLSDEEAYRTVAYSPAISDTLPTAAPMEAVAWREKAQIVTEWLAMARETPKPLHSSLNYVPVSPSEFEALEAILQAMRGA